VSERSAQCVIDVRETPSVVRVELSGEAEMTSAEALADALRDAHSRVLAARHAEVVVDITQLHFANSTCLKQILSWLGRIVTLEAAQSYRVRFLSNPNIHWQRRSLHALASFAPDVIIVENV
jgi:hypothetical protein